MTYIYKSCRLRLVPLGPIFSPKKYNSNLTSTAVEIRSHSVGSICKLDHQISICQRRESTVVTHTSTISSSINSCCVVVMEDLVRPFFTISPRVQRFLPKVLMIIFGGAILSFAYLSKNFDGILEACQSINGVLGGAVLALFTLGIFFPWVGETSAIAGVVAGLAVSIWIFVGGTFNETDLKWTRIVKMINLINVLITVNQYNNSIILLYHITMN